jgi:hypothetical protein
MSLSFARLAALALVFAATPALACEEDEGFIFSCEAGAPDRAIAICGKSEDTGDGLKWTTARIVFTPQGGEQQSYPADPAMGPASFYFSHVFRNDFYEANVRFEKDGASFRLAFRDVSEGSTPAAWLEMTKDGVTAEVARCSEQPFAYFDQMRVTFACDQQNSHGAAGCSNTPPNLK